MKLVSDDARTFLPIFISRIWPMVNIGKKNLESSENNFMNLPLYVFDLDSVAKIDLSYLSPFLRIMNKITAQKSDLIWP